MKRAVSVSIGSSKRDKVVEIELLGEKVRIERIGTDGDMEKAAQLFGELDGVVDAFGLGGADLGVQTDQHYYPLFSVRPIVRLVKKTPLVDGAGLKNTLEGQLAPFIDRHLGDDLAQRRALITSSVDRWGMTMSFTRAGYECVYGDLMFGLGIPLPLRNLSSVRLMARLLMPIAGRLPFEWVYPIGEKQEVRTPKWEGYYLWASVIAGDCHYVRRYMPDDMAGKVIATNTTTPDDVELFRRAGVRHLVTSTPVFEGRSFGTNMLEAAMVAVAGKGRTLTHDELSQMLDSLGLEPQLQTLN
jgi:hypothetical protein